MKTALDTETRLKHSRTRETAACLGMNRLFSGEKAGYRLYALVPVRYVEVDGTPLVDSAIEVDDEVIDLLICKSENHEAVLAVMLERVSWDEDTGTFASYLDGMSCVNLRGKQQWTPEQCAAYIKSYLDKRLPRGAEEADDNPRFTLHTLPAGAVSGETGETPDGLRARLVRERLLHEDGGTTAYGRDCGLLEQYGADAPGKKHRGTAVVQHRTGDLKAALSPRWNALSGKIPLAKRRERLECGLPCDERYGVYTASALRRLLNTPLALLCDEDLQTEAALTEEMKYARGLLGLRGTGPACTYADALKLVYQLYRECGYDCGEFDGNSGELTDQGKTILELLAQQLLRSQTPPREKRAGPLSLKERLRDLGAQPAERYSILAVPVAHYFHAASMLDKSDYPMWFYKRRFQGKFGEPKMNMAGIVDWALGEPQDSDRFTQLYDLLVEPVFPGLDADLYERGCNAL